MTNRFVFVLISILFVFSSSVAAQVTAPNDGRDADRAAIRAHIESIFQAFIDKDGDKLRATHAQDWKGFLEGSPSVMKGRDSYMDAVDSAVRNKNGGMISYKITEFDVTFEGEVAIVCFVADVSRRAGDHDYSSKLRIMDIYGKRDGHWIQIATDTAIHPEAMASQSQTPQYISPQFRKQILDEREKVWRAWFTNDRESLEKLIPEDIITIGGGPQTWEGRADILAGAKGFVDGGGKLISLEFPRTEIQMYGSTILIYTTYKLETEFGGKRNASAGRATENFVIRNGRIVNVGWHLDSSN